VQGLLASRYIHQLSFEQIIPQITSLEKADKRSSMSALMINAFLSVYFDPHTYILPAQYYDEVGSKLERPRYFVGVTYEKERGAFYIRKIVRNSDADLAGLRVNDRILEVNSRSLQGLKIADLSRMLRNQDTPEFEFSVERNGEKLSLLMKRSYRNLKYVDYSEIGSAQKKYALITLAKFARGSCAAMGEALDKAKAAKVAGVVLDLRDNPGGQLDEAGCIEGLFLGANKKAYYVEYFDGLRPNELVFTSDKQKYRGPLVVMLNAYSASASEVLAGSLQVYKRALIVGDRSFGKGTFQEPEEWVINPNVSLFRTQGFYLLPDKSSTQLWGVQPEISLDIDAKAKREADLFLNPLVYTQVPKLRLGDEAKVAHALSLCKNHKLNLPYDDTEVVESIRYLGCADSEHINMAQLSSPNNSF
jgi:carboxyl-terminal processing protease